jgi:hypothetical protein
MENADKVLWQAMRRYIEVSLESMRRDLERIAEIRRELELIAQSEAARKKLTLTDAKLLDINLY